MNRLALLLLCLGSFALGAEPRYITGPFGKNGTWNLYEERRVKSSWLEAWKAAQIPDPLTGSKKIGHLVTIGSRAENNFLRHHLGGWAWIGLTDNEIVKGAKESGGASHDGWAWVTGEPVTFLNWRARQPKNWFQQPGKEVDGVMMAGFGLWDDRPIEKFGDGHTSYIEWDLEADKPIPGAIKAERVLPRDLPKLPRPEQGEGSWQTVVAAGASDLRSSVLKAATVNYRQQTVNNRTPQPITRGVGWAELTHLLPVHGMERFGVRYHATLQVEKPGLYTILIIGDDRCACRIGSLEWKSAAGQGCIDPLDPTVIAQVNTHAQGLILGVINLPAGEHSIDAILCNTGGAGYLQILAAVGAHTLPGDTDQWRLLGHEAKGEVAWPGIDAAGWEVTCTPAKPPAQEEPGQTLQDALLRLRLGKNNVTKKGLPAANFADPESGANSAFFPDPSPFPNDAPGAQDHFALRATATLVIPRDGVYQLGFHTEKAGALRVKGQTWNRLVNNPARLVRINGDTLYLEVPKIGQALGAFVVGEMNLKKGNYPIEALYLEDRGGAVFSVFGSEKEYPPRLLKIDGAEVVEDKVPLKLAPLK